MCGGGFADNEQFQFPPLREGRRVRYVKPWLEQRISIPAPARGATGVDRCVGICNTDFNSRPCARGDFFAFFPALSDDYFNSRPCARGDLQNCWG